MPNEPDDRSKAGRNAHHVYAYRADGLRTRESASTGASSGTWTRYRYDGQMGVEDIEGTTVSGVSTISGDWYRIRCSIGDGAILKR